ncbi:unnamed protein product [Paramecium pentaurelia]|uniref:Uncharacterized protein n=1 Tax=Paramecium pentaurelia TaxID=43138 RepID=A0A8S1Y3W0_9CILI|nr:unnamed protein product [Paramecium pentaurelia]
MKFLNQQKKQGNQTMNKSDQIQNDLKNKEQQKKSENLNNSKTIRKIQKNLKILTNNKAKIQYTQEGYKVYSTEESKIGKGGNSNLCPFDYECCF